MGHLEQLLKPAAGLDAQHLASAFAFSAKGDTVFSMEPNATREPEPAATPVEEPQPAATPVEPEPVVPPPVSRTAMATGKAIVLTNNVVTIAGFALTLLLVGGGAMWNLRGFITSEIERATATTNARLEAAIADIRQEIRAGRESTDRQMAEIRQFIFDLYSDDDPEAEDDGDDADSPA